MDREAQVIHKQRVIEGLTDDLKAVEKVQNNVNIVNGDDSELVRMRHLIQMKDQQIYELQKRLQNMPTSVPTYIIDGSKDAEIYRLNQEIEQLKALL